MVTYNLRFECKLTDARPVSHAARDPDAAQQRVYAALADAPAGRPSGQSRAYAGAPGHRAPTGAREHEPAATSPGAKPAPGAPGLEPAAAAPGLGPDPGASRLKPDASAPGHAADTAAPGEHQADAGPPLGRRAELGEAATTLSPPRAATRDIAAAGLATRRMHPASPVVTDV